MSTRWPLRMEPRQEALAGLLALYVSIPYNGLSTTDAENFIETSPGIAGLRELSPSMLSLLKSGNSWELLGELARLADMLSQEQRDYIGLEIVVGDDFIPTGTTIEDSALYWRRVDVALTAVGAGFAAAEVVEAVTDHAMHLAEESKSVLASMITSAGLIDAAEIVHESQAYVTGVYIPFAGDALRWGQRHLGTFTDDALSLALAADYLRLAMLMDMGRVDSVREYGAALTEDVQDLSKKRALGNSDSQTARQLRLFTTMLSAVAGLLGDDADGMAPDLTPSFLGMRLSEVGALAQAMAINVRSEDGLKQANGEDRSVWSDANWKVQRQWPEPDAPLGKRREVRVWILKQGELISSHQADVLASLKKASSPS